ncbi:MAG TPA: peptidoglycan -binding protein, partial [Rhodobacteraceae bacterium]|nr:peptidoglycan -binding protein [Paracoccaceae bacterium]
SGQSDVSLKLSELEKALTATLLERDALVEQLDAEKEALLGAKSRLTSVEAALAQALLSRDELRTQLTDASLERGNLEARLQAVEIALSEMRSERDALQSTLENTESSKKDLAERLADAESRLALALAESQSLKESLGDKAELREQLAAALAAKLAAEQAVASQMDEADQRAALLAAANEALSREEAKSAESQRQVAALNEQIAALRAQLGSLQAILDEARQRDEQAQVEITNLGTQLNTALARVAAEQRERARLEEEERKRLEAEAKELARYRSDFFGKLRDILGNREGVKIVGDRFVFSSEVLFEPASADLAADGKDQIAHVASILKDVADEIPAEIDWVLRVDGHTDNTPLSGTGRYRDNWELSQARALAVVRFMTEELQFPPDRLAATGFGEYRPIATGDSPEALAQNRRIELKLTER